MKTVLAATAVFALTASSALADCAGHVSAEAGKSTIVASADSKMSVPEPAKDEVTTGSIKKDTAD